MFPDMGGLGVGGLVQQMSGGGPAQSGLPDWMQGGFLANLLGGLKGGPSAGVPGDPMAVGPELPGATTPMGGAPPGAMNKAMGDVGKNMMGFGKSMSAAGTPTQPDLKPNPGPAPNAGAGQAANAGISGLMQMLQGAGQQFPLLPAQTLGAQFGKPGY